MGLIRPQLGEVDLQKQFLPSQAAGNRPHDSFLPEMLGSGDRELCNLGKNK